MRFGDVRGVACNAGQLSGRALALPVDDQQGMLVGLTIFAPAFGQVVQYQFTSPPPVTPLPFHRSSPRARCKFSASFRRIGL